MPYEIKKVFASLPQVERGVSKIIGGDPKGDNFLYTNGKCVILRNIDFTSKSSASPIDPAFKGSSESDTISPPLTHLIQATVFCLDWSPCRHPCAPMFCS